MNRSDAAYFAGLIDGEGTITLQKESKTGFRFPTICVASTSYELVEFCKQASGVGLISTKKTYKLHHKKSYVWRARHNDAINVILDIWFFMREHEKIRRAKLILHVYRSLTKRNGKYSDIEKQRKIEFENEFFNN